MNRSERGSAQTSLPHSHSSSIPNAAVSSNSTPTPTATSSTSCSSPYMSVRYKRHHHHHHHPYRRSSSARSPWWRNPCVIFLLSFAAIGSLRFRVPARSRNAASQLITKQREKRAARLRQQQDKQEEVITDPCPTETEPSMSANCTTSSSSSAASAVRYTLVEEGEGHEDGSSKRAFQKYRVLRTNTDQPVTVQRWAEGMLSSSQASDNNVLAGLVQTIRASPYDAVFFETPPVVALTAASQPFEFVLVDAPRLHAATLERADPHTFAAQFAVKHSESNPWAVAFDNLSGDARLIAPRPPTTTKDKSSRYYYAHLAKFCREAPDEQIAAVWRLAAQEYLDRIFPETTTTKSSSASAASAPVWFSTSGMGVAWLHLRLDAVPKYYTYLPYKHPRQEDE